MKQAHKKRPHLAAANSPPELPDMGEIYFINLDKFKAQTREAYAILCTQKHNSNKNTNIKNTFFRVF